MHSFSYTGQFSSRRTWRQLEIEDPGQCRVMVSNNSYRYRTESTQASKVLPTETLIAFFFSVNFPIGIELDLMMFKLSRELHRQHINQTARKSLLDSSLNGFSIISIPIQK